MYISDKRMERSGATCSTQTFPDPKEEEGKKKEENTGIKIIVIA